MMRYRNLENLIVLCIVLIGSGSCGPLKLSGQDILQNLQQEISTLQNSPGAKMDFEKFADNIYAIGEKLNSEQSKNLAEHYEISRPFELFCLFELTRALPQMLTPIEISRKNNESVANNLCMRIASDVKFREYYMQFVEWTNQLQLPTTSEGDDSPRRNSRLMTFLPVFIGPIRHNELWDHRLSLAIVSNQFDMPRWLDELRSMENTGAWRLELLIHLSTNRFELNGTKFVIEKSFDVAFHDLRNLSQLPPIRLKERPFPIEDELLDKYLSYFPNGVTMIGRRPPLKMTTGGEDR